jgi:hypothetical protein
VAARSGHLQDAVCAGDGGRVGDPVAPVCVAQSKRPVCRADGILFHIPGWQGKPSLPHADQTSARSHWVCRFDLLEVAHGSRAPSRPAALVMPEPTF